MDSEVKYVIPPNEVECVDCGGRAFLLERLDANEEVEAGTILSYRCKDCLDRWDLEIGE